MSEVDICNMALSIIGEAPTVTAIDPADGSPHAATCALWYPKAREAVLALRNWSFASQRVALAHVVVSVSSVSTATNRITTATAHGLADNDVVRYTATTTMPTGLTADTDYYVIYVSTTIIELATAADGDAIDLTGAGVGTMTIEKRSMRAGWTYAYAAPTDMQTPLGVVHEDDADHDQSLASFVPTPNANYVSATFPGPVLTTTSLYHQRNPFKVALDRAGTKVIYTNVEDAHLCYQAYVTDVDQWPAGFEEAVMWRLAAFLAGAIKRAEQTSNWCLGMLERAVGVAAANDANASDMPLPKPYAWDR